jgi:hypothetical protein
MLSDVAWTTFPRSSWSAKNVKQANVQIRQSIYHTVPEYEGAHRWDPDFEWTEAEETAVVRKVDTTEALLLCVHNR